MKNLFIWLPRLIAAVYALFLAVLSLDAFEGSGRFFGKILAFGMHLLPALFVGGALALAWRFRLVGGLFFMILGMVFTVYFGTGRDTSRFWLLSMPLFLAGVLFIFSHQLNSKSSSSLFG